MASELDLKSKCFDISARAVFDDYIFLINEQCKYLFKCAGIPFQAIDAYRGDDQIRFFSFEILENLYKEARNEYPNSFILFKYPSKKPNELTRSEIVKEEFTRRNVETTCRAMGDLEPSIPTIADLTLRHYRTQHLYREYELKSLAENTDELDQKFSPVFNFLGACKLYLEPSY